MSTITTKDKRPTPSDPDAQNLKRLKSRLDQARAQAQYGPKRPAKAGARSAGMAVGFRVVVDLAAGVVVGTGIGIVLDRWLGTTPWFLLVFFMIGSAAGLMNVYRTAQELERKRKAASAEGDGAD
ncbi:MAG: AtpZ/AtpI family protein [Pseudomonadota bacterium]